MRSNIVTTSFVIALLLAACQSVAPGSTPQLSETPSPQATFVPTLTTVPTATALEPVYITAFCTLIGKDIKTYVPRDTPIIITWGWEAKTETQIDDFLQNNITTITLDGKVIAGSLNSGITKNAMSGQPEVAWLSEVGVLDAGQHVITYDVKWKKMIDDGTTTYGPGSKNETLHDECHIIVEAASIASPAPLPGSVVIPMEELGTSVPWLPLDQSAYPSTYLFFFNLSKPPFDNVLARQAFAAAIDREALVKIAQQYGAKDVKPATTFTPPQTLGRYLYNDIGIPFDSAHAKDLLVQAGYTDASQFPAVTLLIGVEDTSAQGLHDSIAQTMVEMWQQNLGIQITIERIDNDIYLDRITSNPTEIFRAFIYPKEINDPDSFLPAFHTGAKMNFGGFSNAEFDELIEFAKKISDPAKRQELYIQAERILCETESAIIPIYHATHP